MVNLHPIPSRLTRLRTWARRRQGDYQGDSPRSKWDGKSTPLVGSSSPNPFGLYDMPGDAAQWGAGLLGAGLSIGFRRCGASHGGAARSREHVFRGAVEKRAFG